MKGILLDAILLGMNYVNYTGVLATLLYGNCFEYYNALGTKLTRRLFNNLPNAVTNAKYTENPLADLSSPFAITVISTIRYTSTLCTLTDSQLYMSLTRLHALVQPDGLKAYLHNMPGTHCEHAGLMFI